jgi:hypothetical protein
MPFTGASGATAPVGTIRLVFRRYERATMVNTQVGLLSGERSTWNRDSVVRTANEPPCEWSTINDDWSWRLRPWRCPTSSCLLSVVVVGDFQDQNGIACQQEAARTKEYVHRRGYEPDDILKSSSTYDAWGSGGWSDQ